MAYRKRVVDDEIVRLLKKAGAIVLEGPKAVGKTETATQHSASIVYLDTDLNARALAKAAPMLLLQGPTPRLVDEWQVERSVWNAIRREVDKRGKFGQFILTGSSVLPEDVDSHTGAGRMRRLRLRPMTFFENGISSGEVSISKLFEDEVDVVGQSDLEIKDVIDQLCIGGWPVYAKLTPNDAQEAMQAYLNEIVHTDMHRVDGVKRDPTRIKKVLRSYSRHISTQADLATISKDVYANTGADNSKTVASDLAVLERLMLVEEIPAWSPHLRSRITLRKTATRHFVDPCLAAAMLSASPTKLFNDLNSFGLLFESLAVRDLRVYSQPLGAELFHYRDNKGLEIDVIISLADGRWAAIEVKLGTAWIDDAAGHLLQLVEKVDAEKIGKPTFLAVLTSTGSAYQRRDGVLVLPIGTLGP